MYNDLNEALIQQAEINQMLKVNFANSDSNTYNYNSRNPYGSYIPNKESLTPYSDGILPTPKEQEDFYQSIQKGINPKEEQSPPKTVDVFENLLKMVALKEKAKQLKIDEVYGKSEEEDVSKKESKPKVQYKHTKTKDKYDAFIKKIPQPLLDCICTVLQKEYPGLYTQDKRYMSLAKNLLFVLNEYSKEKTISKDVYSKIKPIKELFTKDTTRNYSVGNKSQGYTISPKLSKIITAITQQLNLNTELEKLPPSLDCILINKNSFAQASDEVQSYLFSKIQGETTTAEDYFCFNTADYIKEGRSYNTFQQLPKEVKLITNTPYEIDMDSTAQSLMLSIVAKYSDEYQSFNPFLTHLNIREKYPNVTSYTNSKSEKRNLTAQYTGKDREWCKKLYTVPCYGGSSLLTEFNEIIKLKDDKFSFNHATFVRKYTEEMQLLRNELYKLIEDKKLPKEILSFIDIKVQAKKEKNINKEKPEEMTKNWFKKKKIFYCIEYFEGYCRQVLKSELKKNTQEGRLNEIIFRDVHDAVYCNYLFDKDIITDVQTKLEEMGLFVKFSLSYGY